MFWVVDSLMMRKYKTMKSLDDSCDSSVVKKGDPPAWATDEETQVRIIAIQSYRNGDIMFSCSGSR